MRPTKLEEASGGSEIEEGPNDLLGGIGPSHIRILCNPSMSGGFGYDPNQVANFTLDQIWMLLCDEKVLRSGKKRIENLSSVAALGSVEQTKEGLFKGRAGSGKEMKAQIKGKSKARLLQEAEDKKKAEEHKVKTEAALNSARRRKKNQRTFLQGDSN